MLSVSRDGDYGDAVGRRIRDVVLIIVSGPPGARTQSSWDRAFVINCIDCINCATIPKTIGVSSGLNGSRVDGPCCT